MAALAASSVLSTAVVGGILLAAVAMIIRGMWRKRKRTGSCIGCSCGCGDCPHAHPEKK